jgi:hypothetical protein
MRLKLHVRQPLVGSGLLGLVNVGPASACPAIIEETQS